MELWATGFNAFNQLTFAGNTSVDSRDFHTFHRILDHEHESGESIEIIFADSESTVATHQEHSTSRSRCNEPLSKSRERAQQTIAARDNDHLEFHLDLVAGIGSSLEVHTSRGRKIAGAHTILASHIADTSGLIAVAGNGQCLTLHDHELEQFDCLDSLLQRQGQQIAQVRGVKQVAANETSFAALTIFGEVWTWGDSRYDSCLGREVTDESPAHKPALVNDLSELPDGKIVKIASGGFMTAALTDSQDLYVWGGPPGGPDEVLGHLVGGPASVNICDKNIVDVGVGMDHIIVLTADQALFVVGMNTNGQLGMESAQMEHWTEILLPLTDSQQLVGVAAGYRNSFALVNELTG